MSINGTINYTLNNNHGDESTAQEKKSSIKAECRIYVLLLY